MAPTAVEAPAIAELGVPNAEEFRPEAAELAPKAALFSPLAAALTPRADEPIPDAVETPPTAVAKSAVLRAPFPTAVEICLVACELGPHATLLVPLAVPPPGSQTNP